MVLFKINGDEVGCDVSAGCDNYFPSSKEKLLCVDRPRGQLQLRRPVGWVR